MTKPRLKCSALAVSSPGQYNCTQASIFPLKIHSFPRHTVRLGICKIAKDRRAIDFPFLRRKRVDSAAYIGGAKAVGELLEKGQLPHLKRALESEVMLGQLGGQHLLRIFKAFIQVRPTQLSLACSNQGISLHIEYLCNVFLAWEG